MERNILSIKSGKQGLAIILLGILQFVEMDSTYYNIPSRFVVKGRKDKTQDDFKFALKFPKIITHDKKLEGVSKYLYPFFMH